MRSNLPSPSTHCTPFIVFSFIRAATIVPHPKAPRLLASRNIPNVDVIPHTSTNVYAARAVKLRAHPQLVSTEINVMQMLKRHTLVLTVDAVKSIEAYLRPPPRVITPVN